MTCKTPLAHHGRETSIFSKKLLSDLVLHVPRGECASSQDSLHSYMKYDNFYETVLLNQIPHKLCRNKSISVKTSQCHVSPLCASAVSTRVVPVQVDYTSTENTFNVGYCLSGENYRSTLAFL